jgi:AraC-like DNA-binding protein
MIDAFQSCWFIVELPVMSDLKMMCGRRRPNIQFVNKSYQDYQRKAVSYLQKLFAAPATTFGHFIRSLRLDHASQLLRQQTSIKASLPLAEVAYACGYRDYAHFARNFRARFGCAPGPSRSWISSGRRQADT